jgi:terminal protein
VIVLVKSHWGKHYRSFKRGAKNFRNTAAEIRDFVGGLDFSPLPDTLSEEQGKVKVKSAKASAREQHRSDLDKARDLLQVERDRAVRKMYRMATSDDGADIRGTKYDPLGKSAVGKVTLKNAARELERLSEFNNSDSVWYYSDRKGNPISARDVRRYRDAVRRYNADIDAYEKSVSGTRLPYMGDATVGDWIRDFRPKKTYLSGGSHYALERMNPDKRTVNFESDVAMREKTNQVLESLTRKGKQNKLTQAKRQIAAMLDVIGDPELYDILTDIPDDVLWLMWTVNADFANNLSLQYEAAKEGYFDRRRAGDDLYYEDVEDSNSEIKSLLSEIKSINIKPEDDFSGSPINKRKARKGRR